MMPYQFSTTRLKRPESRSRRAMRRQPRSEEHTSELQSQSNLVCRLLLEKKKKHKVQSLRAQNRSCRLSHAPRAALLNVIYAPVTSPYLDMNVQMELQSQRLYELVAILQ